MENNNPVQAAPPAASQPVQPVPQPQASESNKMVLWFVIGLIVVAVLVGGIYMFLSRQQTAKQTTLQTTNTEVMVRATPKPEETVDALDRDLQSVNAGDPTSNFTSVDQDLQQL